MAEDAAETLRIDLRAFRPKPRAIVTWGEQQYPVMSLIDLKYKDMIGILDAMDETAPTSPVSAQEQTARTRRHLQVLVPALSDEVLDQMTYRDMLAFVDAALGVGEGNPPTAGGDAGSSTTSPSPPSSSGGPTTS
jgi:hypothetical protein